MASEEWLEEENQRLRDQVRVQARRLEYAVMLLGREAKFKPTWIPENQRFHKAFAVVTEVRDTLRDEF